MHVQLHAYEATSIPGSEHFCCVARAGETAVTEHHNSSQRLYGGLQMELVGVAVLEHAQ